MKTETTRVIGGKERKCFVDTGSLVGYEAYKLLARENKFETANNRKRTAKWMQTKRDTK